MSYVSQGLADGANAVVGGRALDGSDDAIQLTPPREMTLEFALEFIADGELVEITPKNIRLRKIHLTENARKQAAKRRP